MTREEKTVVISELKEQFSNSPFFYLTDSSTLSVGDVNKLRRKCFEKGITMKVVKNSLIQKALEGQSEAKGYEALFPALKGHTAIMFSDVANAPAKLIAEFRGDKELPSIKAAYIDSAVYMGDSSIGALKVLKSKEELVGSPVNVNEPSRPSQTVGFCPEILEGVGAAGATFISMVEGMDTHPPTF